MLAIHHQYFIYELFDRFIHSVYLSLCFRLDGSLFLEKIACKSNFAYREGARMGIARFRTLIRNNCPENI